MNEPSQAKPPQQRTGLVMGALSMAIPGVSVALTQSALHQPSAMQGRSMTPQDQALIDARMDAKVADLKGDLRLNTQGWGELKSRFDELSTRLASVPVDIATLKTKVEHLPGKGFVFTVGVGTVTGIGALLIALQRLGILH